MISLLIEPVWNRNSAGLRFYTRVKSAFNRTSMESKLAYAQHVVLSKSTFNRTSMESKHRLRLRSRSKLNSLLIEPVWNRNISLWMTDSQKWPHLLIEPVWNRNCGIPTVSWVRRFHSFNRTSMESKLSRDRNVIAISAARDF